MLTILKNNISKISSIKQYATGFPIYRAKLINLGIDNGFFSINNVENINELDKLLDIMPTEGWILHKIIPLTYRTSTDASNPTCSQLLVIIKKDIVKK